MQTANISDAALFRAVAELSPTLLMDEVDAIWKSREREELRGLLNAGYRRGAVAHRMGGANNRNLETFPVFSPKAFAGARRAVTERLLTAEEVGELLSVPTSWVREQTRRPDGTIPHLRLGRYVRFEREAVLAWLETQRAGQWRKHKPVSNDAAEAAGGGAR